MQARQPRGVFRPLTLGIIEIGGNGNHHAIQLAGERFASPRGQRFENISRYAYRIEQSSCRVNHRQPINACLKPVRQMRIARLDIRQRASHHAFHRADSVGRILRGIVTRSVTDRMALLLIVNH